MLQIGRRRHPIIDSDCAASHEGNRHTPPGLLPLLPGAVFAFIISFDELVLTLFLAGPSLQTLPLRIYSRIEYASDPIISAVSTCMLTIWLLIGVPIYTRMLRGGRGA